MAMLTLNGTVANVFHKSGGVDKKTGEAIPPSDHVQIMAENVLQNGEKRMELVTLKVGTPEAYKSLLGRPVRVPVGAFVSGSTVLFYALKGETTPEEGV